MNKADYRQKVDALQASELAGIGELSDAELAAGLERWRAERAAITADWARVGRLPAGHPEREAVADRDGLARLAEDAYAEVAQGRRVARLLHEGKSAEAFLVAGTTEPEQW